MMKELADYSGEFLHELDFRDFSHDTLVNLLITYAKLYIAMDGFWYISVMGRNGNEEALACDIQAWNMMVKYEMKALTKALNIQGHDPIAFIKTMQVSPWFQHMKYTVDIENSGSIIMTVTYCPTLDALEKEGKGRQQAICNLEPQIFQLYASLFNTDMRVESLAPLPRQRKNDHCCKWSVKLPS